MGNCTVTLKKRTGITPTGTAQLVTINLSSSYATNGDTLTRASLGVSQLHGVILGSATSPAGHAVEFVPGANDGTDPKIRVRDVATGTEITSTTNLSAQSIQALVIADFPNV